MPIITSIALAFTAMTSFAGVSFSAQTPIDPPALTPAMVLNANENPELDAWIDRLVFEESGGREHFRIVDVNGYYSYGCLQFQKWTFINYGTRYDVLKEGDDIDTLIYDCGVQKTIAKLMIQDDYKNWRHWYTSAKKKIGLPPTPPTAETDIQAERGNTTLFTVALAK